MISQCHSRRLCDFFSFYAKQSSLLLKIAHPRPLFCLFSVFFKQTMQIWCRDSNSQPSDYESPPLTARTGLPGLAYCYYHAILGSNPGANGLLSTSRHWLPIEQKAVTIFNKNS